MLFRSKFLEELRERARRYGWDGDYTELISFCNELYRQAGHPLPDMTPYKICPVCDKIAPDCSCSERYT